MKDDFLDDVFQQNYYCRESIGTGSFANVHIVSSKTSGELYAAKIINKQRMLKKRVIESLDLNNKETIFAPSLPDMVRYQKPLSPFMSEFEIMQCITDHPNTIHPHQGFETTRKAYLIME